MSRTSRSIAAVIVTHRAPQRAVAAARALPPVEHVFVVDNGGADAALLRADLPEATVVVTPENLGFAGGANAGSRAALATGAGAVLFVNDDATLAPGALDLLRRALEEPGVGLVAPATVEARDGDTIESLGLSFARTTGRLREVGRGASHRALDRRAPREVDGLSGCALLASREVLEATGGFDDRFFFYFEDLDLCLRARRAGWRSVVVPDAVALHEGSATIGRRSVRRLYHAVRGHLRLGRSLGGRGAVVRQAAVVAWNVGHALRRRGDFEPGALRAVLRGVADHLRDREARG